MDATASRERTWDNACQIQNQMFIATDDIGGINIQLCYYRGFNQFQYSGWFVSGKEMIKEMAKVSCLGGRTQIAKIFKHALEEHKAQKMHGEKIPTRHDRIEKVMDLMVKRRSEAHVTI